MPEIDNISNIIAGLNPDMYTERKNSFGPVDKSGFKKALKEDFWEALKNIDKKYNLKPTCVEEHKLVYDSSSETLEPVYFWILDFIRTNFGLKIQKYVDNFSSSSGGGHFSEMMMKATRMQEESTKILANVNTVIKSIINIIYDLKEFELRLSQYNSANSKDKEKSEAGLLALKQIWLDNVDIKRSAGSIHSMTTGNLNFVTLRDAFLIANSVEDVDTGGSEGKGMDLNDRVKRILKPRLQEFFQWKEISEKEIKKRYEIEKTYLKSQVNALQLYSRWAKPYLKSAAELEQKDLGKEPELVKSFNTIILELALLGTGAVDFEQAIVNKKLPPGFKGKKIRKYSSCLLVDFHFRGIPQKTGQHYTFGGRVEVTFRAYGLNEDELKALEQKFDESSLKDALKLVEGTTTESLAELKEDIDYFLKEGEKKEKSEEKNSFSDEDVNPFSALIGRGEKEEKSEKEGKEEKKEKIKEIKEDSYIEETVRKIAEEAAQSYCFTVFDIYKKAHGMASHPSLLG